MRIYASSVPTIVGANPYCSPYEQWEIDTGRRPRPPQSIHARAGELLEQLGYEIAEKDGVAAIAAQKRYSRVITDDVEVVARVDGILSDGRLLSIKTTGRLPDELPRNWQIQSLIEGWLASSHGDEPADSIVLAIDRGTLRYAYFEVAATYSDVEPLLDLVRTYADCVRRDIPPPPVTVDDLARSDDVEEVVELPSDDRTGELMLLLADIKRTRKALAELEARRDAIASALIALQPARCYTLLGKKVASVIQPAPREAWDDEKLLALLGERASDFRTKKEVKPYWRWWS